MFNLKSISILISFQFNFECMKYKRNINIKVFKVFTLHHFCLLNNKFHKIKINYFLNHSIFDPRALIFLA